MNKKINIPITILFVMFFVSSLLESAEKYIHHNLKVDIRPELQFVRVEDQITIPAEILKKRIHFLLHGNLAIKEIPDNTKIKHEKRELKKEFFGINTARFEIKKKIPLNHYSFKVPGKVTEEYKFFLVYEGKIHHPIEKIGAEYARGFSETPGIICEKGVYLAGSSFWIPWFNDDLITFKLEVTLPQGWDVLSQGKKTLHSKQEELTRTLWDSPEPMNQVYLVAARFLEYNLKVGDIDVMAFLRSKDDSLANKYLETTGQYLEMYEKLIGPFPYAKFALVENFWETGYGMASFTLLGEKVIRFPFILHSSYPHELLHNWLGNSIFVDYESGNWCEGLTTFLADHLIKEQRGQGSEYRKTTLQDYTDYAAGKEKEFPLTEFRSRYDALSSAIGYGKSLMIFNMLRHEVGDKLFIQSLQEFYRENKFRRTSFEDLRMAFEKTGGKDFKAFFDQWLSRKGAPEIRLAGTKVTQEQDKYQLDFTLEQVQAQQAFTLKVPAAIFLEGHKEAVIKNLEFKEKKQNFLLTFDSRPVRIDIDPEFDVFRIMHQDEILPALSRAFGAKSVLILLPARATADFLQGYRQLAENWARDNSGQIEVKMDHEFSRLPADRAVWLFGNENSHKPVVAQGILKYNGTLDEESFSVRDREKKTLAFGQNSIVVTVKNPQSPAQVIVLLSTDRVEALPGLGRKLPHYGKYSYLAFEGDEPSNHLKGQWQPEESPLGARLTASSIVHSLPERVPLARLAPLFSQNNMMQHIRYLASEELEGRGLGSKGIAKAAAYIANDFKKAGLIPGGDKGSYLQRWYIKTGKENWQVELFNVIGIIPGTSPGLRNKPVVVCAHYDHLGLGWPDVHKGNEGKIHFGADDNASGAAVLLELANRLGQGFKPERSIVFIAFTGEESGLLGSKYYLDSLEKDKLKNILAVVNLDTVGRFEDEKNNKLLVIGGSSAREWRFIFMGIGYTTGIDTELITQELDASDQVSFIQAGIPAVQLFAGPSPDYHRPGDTVDKIIPSGLVKAAAVAREAIVYLAARQEPLTFTGATGEKRQPAQPTPGQGSRKVRTGIMPDFSYSDKGVKVAALSPDSPAQRAGLQKGDIIIRLGDQPVTDLKGFADVLKSFKPGDTTSLHYIREGKEFSAQITLEER